MQKDTKKTTPITGYVNNYRKIGCKHIKRMDRAKIPKQFFSTCTHWMTTARKIKDKMV
jgi:hypothetical protein